MAVLACRGALAEPALTSVRDIREMSSQQAGRSHPVMLHGVVTTLSGWKTSFFFQDGTSGISVDRMDALPAVEAGDEVVIEGVTTPGKFAPVVNSLKVSVLAKHRLPPAPARSAAELMQGRQDAQWMTVNGIVRSVAVLPRWGRQFLTLKIDLGAGNQISASVYDYHRASLPLLPGATVSVRGVCGTIFNDRRQFVGLRLFVADMDEVRVERPGPAAPFSAAARPLGEMLQFDPRLNTSRQIKVSGVVTYLKPGQGVYLQDATGGAFIESQQMSLPKVGSQVEAVGYAAVGAYSPKLEDALVRVVGVSMPPRPVVEEASRLIVSSDGFASAPRDSVLVQVKGRIVEKFRRPTEDVLMLKQGSTVFTARVPRFGSGLDAIDVGSVVTLTGVCAVEADVAREIHAVEILLRTPLDVTVVQAAPWWTPTHALWVVVALVPAMIGMLGWMVLVRRQQALRELAVTDPLTGLYNRRGFLLLAQQQWQLALRRQVSFLLFYIDVDKFKEINDTYGHKEGDLALRVVAKVLQETFRKADILGRLGGDEFAVAAIDASEDSAGVLKGRIAVALQQCSLEGHQFKDLTLSIGVLPCDSSLGPVAIEELLTRADGMMYEQKRGRKAAGRMVGKSALA